jgi:hypothetical protein
VHKSADIYSAGERENDVVLVCQLEFEQFTERAFEYSGHFWKKVQ